MINLNYNCLLQRYDEAIKYFVNSSDVFSIITYMKKPYSKRPPICYHDDKLKSMSPYLINQIVGIRRWGNSGTSNNHSVMNIYRCNKYTLKALQNFENVFLSMETDFPEDICFYRKNAVWLSTVSHEKLAFVYKETEEDMKFFKNKGILYHFEEDMTQYHLPFVIE